jgi:hypothetical protein
LSGGLIYLDDFTSFIKAALWADAMLHAWLLTIGTGYGLRDAQSIVCSTLAAPRF